MKTLASLGAPLAAGLSYAQWHSLGWAFVNALFGWAYVAYVAFSHYVH